MKKILALTAAVVASMSAFSSGFGLYEPTAIGNLIVQMIAGGEFADLAAARAAIA